MKPIQKLICMVTIIGLSFPVFCHADRGTADLISVAVSVSSSVQMGDTTVTARGGTGALTVTRGGGPFLEGTSASVQFVSFSKKTTSGFELEADGLATFSSDDTLQLLFKRRTGDLAAGTSGDGVLHLTGGSGRFAGIKGECKYKVENLSGTWNVTTAKCNWHN